MNFKTLSTTSLALLSSWIALTANAMTTYPYPIEVTLQDGQTKVEIVDNGDEQDNWLSDTEGYTVEQDEDTGDFFYMDEDPESDDLIRTSSRLGRERLGASS